MVTKGVIKSINSGLYTVEIPKYDLVVEVEGEEDLPDVISTNSASDSSVKTSTYPGIVPTYKEGDEVFICIEDNVLDKIVIMGLASRPNPDTNTPMSNMTAGVLKVVTEAILPANTKIGDVTKDNIATLKGMTVNIATKFGDIERQRDSLLDTLSDMFDQYFK